MKKTLWALCAVTTLITACNDKQPGNAFPSENAAGRTVAPQTPATRSADDWVRPIPDHSLTVKEYIDAGVPSPDQPWTGQDYQSAAVALLRISNRDYAQLPRLDSPNSGPLFARMVAPENLDALRLSAFPIQQRVQCLAELNRGFLPLLVLYQTKQRPRQSLDAEVVRLTLFMFDYTALSFSLVGEFMSALPSDDERRDPNYPGLNKARETLAASISAALEFLDQHDIYRPPQRVLLAEGLQARCPHLFLYLPEDQREEFRARLTKMAESESDPRVKQALQKMSVYRPPIPTIMAGHGGRAEEPRSHTP
jgi:hypothetical protein